MSDMTVFPNRKAAQAYVVVARGVQGTSNCTRTSRVCQGRIITWSITWSLIDVCVQVFVEVTTSSCSGGALVSVFAHAFRQPFVSPSRAQVRHVAKLVCELGWQKQAPSAIWENESIICAYVVL